MSETLAQAAPSNSASNANDFQPTTQNPQSVPANLFQQQGSSQTVTNPQELLNEQKNSQIIVTKEPAPAQSQVRPAGNATGLVLMSLIAVALAILLFKISSKIQTKPKTAPDATIEAEKTATEKAVLSAPKPKKKPKTSKKKSSKKSARKHR